MLEEKKKFIFLIYLAVILKATSATIGKKNLSLFFDLLYLNFF